MARNRQDLVRTLSAVTSELLKEKGYICFVDVLLKLDYLSQSDYEHWRFQRVSPLERVLRVNLSRINFIMKTVRRNSLNGHLKPSMTVYKSWGKGKKARRRCCNFPNPVTRRLRRPMPPISSGLNMWTRRLPKTVQITGRVRSRKPLGCWRSRRAARTPRWRLFWCPDGGRTPGKDGDPMATYYRSRHPLVLA